MKPLIIDNFIPHAPYVRSLAEQVSFGPVEYEGHTFNGIGRCSIHMAPALEQAVGFPVDIELQFFRLGVERQEQPTYIQCGHVGSQYACVLGLTRPEHCQGGTAFWKHRKTGLSSVDTASDDSELLEILHNDSHFESAWKMEYLADLCWNRAVIYPASRFHSRYPRDQFGSSIEDGRLVWCGFFSEAM